jgi:hypothetical protein
MGERLNLAPPEDPEFDIDAEQHRYDREFYSRVAAAAGFREVFGTELATEVSTDRRGAWASSDAPDTFTDDGSGPNTDTDPGKTDSD